MARTSQAHKGTGATVHVQHQVGVWIQYRGPRARTLQTTRLKSARSNLTAGIVAEFFADLEALTLTIPGVTMVDVRIVWGTGQIRAQYGLNHGLHFYAAVKYLIKRAVSLFRDRMSERSIARVWYTENGSPVEIDSLPLVCPPQPLATRPSSSQSPLGSRANASSTSSDLRLPATSSSLSTSSRKASPTHRSPTLSSQPLANAPQSYPGVHLPVSTLPHQVLTLKPLFPAPQTFHNAAHGPLEFPIPSLSPISPGGRDSARHLGSNVFANDIQAAETDTPMLPAGILSDPQRAIQSPPPLAMPLVHLTPGVCARLKDSTDADVLSTCPVLRILVLRSADSAQGGTAAKSHEAFVTDGQGYAWLAFTSSATARIGDRNDRRSVQVGSAVRLKKMGRLPAGDLCTILVDSLEVADNLDDGILAALSLGNSAIRPEVSLSPGFALHTTSSPQPFIDPPAGGISVHERAARLLADAKFREERRRRLALERALADVCGDLYRLESLTPVTTEALRKIDELTSAVMPLD